MKAAHIGVKISVVDLYVCVANIFKINCVSKKKKRFKSQIKFILSDFLRGISYEIQF